jgi:hypothetical protein
MPTNLYEYPTGTGIFPRTEREDEHSPPSSAECKNVWSLHGVELN